MARGNTEKILVTLLGGAADFFKAQAFISAIFFGHPQASVSLLTAPVLVDMAKRSRRFADVFADRAKSALDVAAKIKLYQSLKQSAFDGIYHLGAPLPFTARRAVAAVPVLEIAAADIPAATSLDWMETDVSLFGLQKPYVLLLPGHARTAWPAVRYAAVAMKLIREGYDVAIIGTDADFDVAQKIRRVASEVKDMTGRTSYYDIYSLARAADGMVGASSAALHLAGMAGCPVVALLPGWADLQADTPAGDAVTVIQADDMLDVTVDDVIKNMRARRRTREAV